MPMVIIVPKKQLMTVLVIYYRPQYVHILQEFLWQVDDVTPELPRIKRFIRYWKNNIDAIISEICLSESGREFHPVDLMTML